MTVNLQDRPTCVEETTVPPRRWKVGDRIAGRGVVVEYTVHDELVDVVFSTGRRLLVVTDEVV